MNTSMSNAKHTATPYQVGNFSAYKIFTCEEGGPVEVATVVRKADAPFIVRACNRHSQLLAALEVAIGRLEKGLHFGSHVGDEKLIEQWRAAIKAAT